MDTASPAASPEAASPAAANPAERPTVVCNECKRKKTKCDKEKPCGECIKAKTTEKCIYVESSKKRGIPGGYMAALEARLLETEAALYNTASEFQGVAPTYSHNRVNGQDTMSDRQKNIERAAKMEEWAKYPLGSALEVQKWWNIKNKGDNAPVAPVQGDEDNSQLDPRLRPGHSNYIVEERIDVASTLPLSDVQRNLRH